MDRYIVPLPDDVAITGLDQAFAVETVAAEDGNAFTTKSRETLLQAPAGGPYIVSLYRYVSDRYHRRPCVTLTPANDGRSVTVAWADRTERLLWTTTMAAAAVFAVVAVACALSISLVGLILLLPAAMMIVIGQKTYRSSSAVQRQDCADAVAVALRAGVRPPAEA